MHYIVHPLHEHFFYTGGGSFADNAPARPRVVINSTLERAYGEGAFCGRILAARMRPQVVLTPA